MIRTLPLFAFLSFALITHAAGPLTFEPVATGLTDPVAITHAGDSRLFITLQAGRILIRDGSQLLSTPFLDIRPIVGSGGERGLLGLAFHPHYAENGFFFVNYTDLSGNTVVARYHVSVDPNRADPASRKQLLSIEQPFANHNGGELRFGPDGYLYIGMGDGGSGGDPGNRAQNPGILLGKMLRIDVDAGDPYAIPPSNPFVGVAGTRPEIWALGLRNPWRFTFDRETGALWIADVGQGTWEEVNYQPRTSIGGENYGWRLMEGTHCFNPSSNCNPGNLVLPVLEYDHSGGACSVTGGFVYRGARYPLIEGSYLYGDYCTGTIWGAVRSDTSGLVTVRELASTNFQISAFGEDLNGELYVADYNGAVYHIVDPRPLGPRRRAVRP
ncbi:MAG: PQQ-dependent sugar dehydrogenase [Acidobacteriota bacterium]